MSRCRCPIVELQAPNFMVFTVLKWLLVFTCPDTVQMPIIDGPAALGASDQAVSGLGISLSLIHI